MSNETIEDFLKKNASGESANDLLSRIIATLRMSEQWKNFAENPQYKSLLIKHCENRASLKNLVTITTHLEKIAPSAEKILSRSFRTNLGNQ